MKKINKILNIGNNKYENIHAILAPMAGFTDLPFRLICEEYGCNFTFTEMINAKALCYHDEKTTQMLDVSGQKKYVGVQIFGSEIEYIGKAVKIINDLERFSHIDINMGCPAPKIVKNGDGSALMKNPSLASKIVEEAKKNSSIPVTVKIRKGFDEHNINAVEFAKMLEQSGADAITVHGRTTRQYYSGVADWDIIAEVKQAVKVPVIGNGDVKSPEDAKRMMEYTSCDSVLIARAAQGNPFLFAQINDYFENGSYDDIQDSQRVEIALKHYKLSMEKFETSIAVREMRKQINCYLKGIKNSCVVKNQINMQNDYEKVIEMLENFAKSLI
ncbi:TIM-barrel protein, nifR3 family [[Eubacterium] yurii subsp. margaretiae ATCC 43715]|nr:TIM-barrel protein, nifR3 family [[Eubacterium] yurii subsp. margaretiae ATCC 43715]